jgi:hypothetical protein
MTTYVRCPDCGIVLRGHAHHTSGNCPRCLMKSRRVVEMKKVSRGLGPIRWTGGSLGDDPPRSQAG